MSHSCTEDRFLNDTKDHTMNIIMDNGLHRHISFTYEGSSVYRFDLITWPGHLCICGDCGTYVFSRIADMFAFFRMRYNDFNKNIDGSLSINPSYWGEKLESVAKNGGYKEFDPDKFKDRVKMFYAHHTECDEQNIDESTELWSEIKDRVLSKADDGEHVAYQAAYDFEHDGFHFQDFFDGGGTEKFTFRYIWCLYAIAWGIWQYDKHKPNKGA